MMRPDVIPKDPGCIPILPNMIDYGKTCESFSWEAVRSELLKGSIEKGINIAELAVDRHAAGMRANHVAIRWLGKNGAIRDLTFSDLHAETNRFANLLGALGTKKGERVFSLLGRVPELHVAALGTLKSGCIFCPLFAAFGPEPIRERLSLGDARVLVTTENYTGRRSSLCAHSFLD